MNRGKALVTCDPRMTGSCAHDQTGHSLCSRGRCCACSSHRNPQHRCNPGRRLPSTPASSLGPAPRRWAARFCNPPAVSGWCHPCCSAPPWPHSHNQWKTTFCGGLESSVIYFVGGKTWILYCQRHNTAVQTFSSHIYSDGDKSRLRGFKHQHLEILWFKQGWVLMAEINSLALMQRASEQMLRFSSRVVKKSPYHYY